MRSIHIDDKKQQRKSFSHSPRTLLTMHTGIHPTLALCLGVVAGWLVPVTLACDSHSTNVCITREKTCTAYDGRLTDPTTGEGYGEQSASLTHADMTIGCYCQLAQTTFHSGNVVFNTRSKALSSLNFVTTCDSDRFTAYWDGVYVMNTTGGSLGGRNNDEYSVTYNEILCSQYVNIFQVPSSDAGP